MSTIKEDWEALNRGELPVSHYSDKNQVMILKDCALNDNLTFAVDPNTINYLQTSLGNSLNTGTTTYSCWDYWQHGYYPYVIHESYPVYLLERAKDKGKQAFELIKMLKDKRFINLEKVGDFIDLMDELIKIL